MIPIKFAWLAAALGLATGASLVLAGYFLYYLQFFDLGSGLGTDGASGVVAGMFVLAALPAIYCILVIRAKKLRKSAIVAGFLVAGVLSGISCGTIGYLGNTFLAFEPHSDVLAALYSNQAQWETRAAAIRQGILSGAQLVPLPDRTPLNAVIHDKRVYGNYSIENVYFESVPGFFISGNLYRPTWGNDTDSKPVILVPHGHFPLGRFEPDNQEVAATFARMGAIVMIYDMVGWGESMQVSNASDFTPMFQIWDSMRVVDFLLTLPGADPTRVAVTGASGGGTQAILLAAVDDRIAAAAPVVMVSASYAGGPEADEVGMPIRESQGHWTNNAEIAALMAPKPLLLVSDGADWTQDNPQVEYPFIQRIYGFYNETGNVQNAHFANEGHDFGPSKRDAVYDFFASHLGLNISNVEYPNGTIDEVPNVIENQAAMYAYTSAYPLPADALQGEAAVLQAFTNAQQGMQHVDPGTIVYVPTIIILVVLEFASVCFVILQQKRLRIDAEMPA
ncbi:MAG TPA: CocE/NonD family hydrolase [Candidatus Lokiarchaeia archaeon]|nr:CocE/NonD family hydrolase [Candidatus Lokiarchaeia archaeon]